MGGSCSRGLPLAEVTTSLTISGPAIPVFCMLPGGRAAAGAAEISVLKRATLQDRHLQGNYIAAEGVASSRRSRTCRLIADLMEFSAPAEIPDYKPLSVSGYHIRGSGRHGPRKSLRSPWADGFWLHRAWALPAGSTWIMFAARPFHSSSMPHIDFFEEIAKFPRPRGGSGRGGCANT